MTGVWRRNTRAVGPGLVDRAACCVLLFVVNYGVVSFLPLVAVLPASEKGAPTMYHRV